MLSCYRWKSSWILLVISLCLATHSIHAQRKLRKTDSLSFMTFNDKWVVYSDYGFGTAPYSLKFRQADGDKIRLKYRNNYRTILGLGFSYKWLALRIGIPIPGNFRPISRFGRSSYFNIGFDFSFRKFYFDFDARNMQGYAIQDAYKWNDTLNELNPNALLPQSNNLSISLNTYYFQNKHFRIQPILGKTAYYTKPVRTFYLKSTMNIHGVGNNQTLIPNELIYAGNSKLASSTISDFDFGFVPGYAFVGLHKHWQFSALAGFGPVIQAKFYQTDEFSRGFLGVAPRYDIRFVGGYNVPKFFFMLVTEFDNKSIRFQDLRYHSSFYSIKIVGGYRFLDSKKELKKKEKQLDQLEKKVKNRYKTPAN